VTFTVQAAVAARDFDVSLTVEPGETVAVMGPNGAGKSTLLNVVAGLLHPDSGKAELDGKTLFNLAAGRGEWTAPHRRGTALLAQEPLLFPHLSVLENVAFGPRSAGVSKHAARASALRWLAEVEAVELQSRRPAQLSGGQAQRVAVARALVTEPRVVFADEPTGSLDSTNGELVMELLVSTARAHATSVVLVTHEPQVAAYADREVVVRDGRVAHMAVLA